MNRCSTEWGHDFASYLEFERYCSQNYRAFWHQFVQTSGLLLDGAMEPVCQGDNPETAIFFERCRLNYVENLLRIDSSDAGSRTALTVRSALGPSITLTRQELLDRVVIVADALKELGVRPGDRVVSILRNDAEAVVAALATLRLGATFSSASADMGAFSILARFRQLEPSVLFAHMSEPNSSSSALAKRIAEVADGLPSLRLIVSLDNGFIPVATGASFHRMSEFLQSAPPREVPWERFPFNHPLFIMFSSGTTGSPKAIVHGAGGTLIEHVKEHRLHLDLKAGETLFFQTSAAWMMWNWQLSALATQVGIVLNSDPLLATDTLWQIADIDGVNVLGTSPPYLQMCEGSGVEPRQHYDLQHLRAILSTGSILFEEQYRWVRDHVGPLPLMSISGGTDILGCFLLGNVNLPVYAGQLQSRSLGMDVTADFSSGTSATQRAGDLVCRNPFPSRPLGFVADESGTRFHNAYFSAAEGVWTHGDLVEFTDEGGARILGRSDGVLNVEGVRIGPAEIYLILQGVSQIRDALVVEQPFPGGSHDARLVLLLVMRHPGELTPGLRTLIRKTLKERGSAAHVPAVMVEVAELPTTYSGKRSEHAARSALSGQAVDNAEALQNPACLDVIRWQVALDDGRQAVNAADLDLGTEVDPMLSLIISAWQEVLRLPTISGDDDFFELGGSSLQVMRVFDIVRQTSGITLALSTMYRASTPAALAEVLHQEGSAATQLAVLLREGVGDPVFLIHDITGDLLYQRSLVSALSTSRPVYGLRAREVDGRGAPLMSVDAMSAEYVDHVRLVQPLGPYTLLGYSFGGLVALEMARGLLESGDDIDYLALIDSYVQSAYLPKRLLQRAQRTAGLAAQFMRSPRTALPGIIRRQLATRAHWMNVELLDEDILLFPPGLESCNVANRDYRAAPFPGDVTVYYASARPPGYRRTDRDWITIVLGDLSRHEAPGSHFTMVKPPHACELAQLISRELSRASRSVAYTAV